MVARMRYDAASRSVVAAYLIWFFLGYGGVHRMYLGRWGSGLVMLAIFGVSMLLTLIFIGYLGLGVIGIWWLLDALLIPGMAQRYNDRLIDRIAR
ncbi:TM2 domain-containing protein [Roseococcus sp. SYP-B2431]|nr:TM2 domain-containing protein [Roseococcus sp. SYP-B2431]